MSKIIYLDNNATTKVADEVREEISTFLKDIYGNPSSTYNKGREAKKHLGDAREMVASFFNCREDEVVFTSCGSESNNLALKGTFFSSIKPIKHIITCKTEHPSIINTCESLKELGAKITYLNVDRSGHMDLDELKKSITDETILISLMLANNETGVINDIKAISEIASERGVLLHTDAVQASGKMGLDVKALNVDMLSISGHKFHAPKGIGALYVKKGLLLKPLIDGGGQEFGMRAGTENSAYIAGLKKACELVMSDIDERAAHMLNLKKEFFSKITSAIDGVVCNGDFEKSLPNTLNLSFKDVDVQSLLISLDLKGIMVSAGSACASGAPKASRVLTAMGLNDDLLKCVLRISFSAYSRLEEVMEAADVLIETVNSFRDK
ncbi:cysteine desulfurase family protein [Thermodesulfobacteriota bacterium]